MKNFKNPYLIAEIGVNFYDISKKYNLSLLDAAKLMIKKAKIAGASAVKFQTYKANKLASKNSPGYWDFSEENTKTQYDLFKKYDKLSETDYKLLSKYCKQKNIDFLSTPFDKDSVDFLDPLVKYFKVASADITNLPLLIKVANKGKDVFLSTGASTIEEINIALDTINSVNSQINVVLLHCVLSYPTSYNNANLGRIPLLSKEFKENEIGYSDHTKPDKNMLCLTTAALLGAKVIEKHFTLDKKIKGNDHYHSMDVSDLRQFNNNLKLISKLVSKNEIDYLDCEKKSRNEARRSIVLTKNLKKGTVLKKNNLIMKRPGHGISPLHLDKVLGKKVKKNLKQDHILLWDDLY